MEFRVGITMSSRVATVTAASSSLPRTPLNEDSMWPVNFRSGEPMHPGLYPYGPYPEREGEPDCSFYIRTGLCRFGSACRFNHPPNRKLAIAATRMSGEHPERIGQPECQYYLKTGTCKFGATCKFHHPKEKAGIAGRVPLNNLGYPLRPNETECAYYLRTGQCKFGSTCKFHHPQPSNMTASVHGSPSYPAIQSSTTPGQHSYPGSLTSWPLSRASIIPSPRWRGPSSYAPVIVPQGMVSVPGWNYYSGQSVPSSGSQQHAAGSSSIFAASPAGLQRENVFPERPGQPECQYFMKTGDCKFGAVCRFHHPKQRLIPAPDCLLSPMGLPLRPGGPLCTFYSRYGICKYGPSCKFDHPMGVFVSNLSPTSSDASNVRRYLASSSASAGFTLSSEGLVDTSSGKTRRLSLSETREIPSGDDNLEAEE